MTLTLFYWVLAVLAVYRISYLFTIDNGPAHVFLEIRAMMVRRYGAGSWQAEGAACLFCQSVWYSALAALLFAWQGWQGFLILWLSIAGACAVLHWLVLFWMAKVNGV